MNENIRKYVNDLFMDKPNTKRVNDLKDEIISNANEKYMDLLENKVEEKDAFEKVVANIGDVGELVDEIERNNPINVKANDKERKKTALVVSLAIGLYILTMICMIVLDELDLPDFVMGIAFFIISGFATCLLIYHFMSRPKYDKYDDTLIEEFKEWKDKSDKNKEVKRSINSILWMIVTILYFVISFTFMNWYISWVIFLIAGLVQNVIELLFKLGEK